MKAAMGVAIAVLSAVVVWLGVTVIRLENYRYAGAAGSCYEAADYSKDMLARARREACLQQTETRTSGAWHLVYALRLM
jgi:hypothetical protein